MLFSAIYNTVTKFFFFFFRNMIYVGLEPAAPNRLADESHSHYPGKPPRHPQKKNGEDVPFKRRISIAYTVMSPKMLTSVL